MMAYKDKQKDKECKARWQREHPEQHREASSNWQKRNPEKARAKEKRWRINNPDKVMLKEARKRAKQKTMEFSIDLSDIVIPNECPVFLVPMVRGTPYAPSLDRIDSTKGYVKGNVWVISLRANKIKSDASLAELKQLVAAVKTAADSGA